MAKRQSLKDLQERLAQRLTAAKTDAATASWLAIEAHGQGYLVPLVQSGEIFPWASTQVVPYTKPWYVGVASLRGGLFGVVDLARYLGAQLPSTLERVSQEARLVSLHAALGVNAVLWIDRLMGLRNPTMFVAVDARPEGAHACITRCLRDAQGRSWQELDLMALAQEAEFLAIAA